MQAWQTHAQSRELLPHGTGGSDHLQHPCAAPTARTPTPGLFQLRFGKSLNSSGRAAQLHAATQAAASPAGVAACPFNHLPSLKFSGAE